MPVRPTPNASSSWSGVALVRVTVKVATPFVGVAGPRPVAPESATNGVRVIGPV
jgi:hypothetical protein